MVSEQFTIRSPPLRLPAIAIGIKKLLEGIFLGSRSTSLWCLCGAEMDRAISLSNNEIYQPVTKSLDLFNRIRDCNANTILSVWATQTEKILVILYRVRILCHRFLHHSIGFHVERRFQCIFSKSLLRVEFGSVPAWQLRIMVLSHSEAYVGEFKLTTPSFTYPRDERVFNPIQANQYFGLKWFRWYGQWDCLHLSYPNPLLAGISWPTLNWLCFILPVSHIAAQGR